MERTDRIAVRVWDRLIEAYGTRVIDTFGKAPPPTWVLAIKDLTDSQIAYGLRKVVRDTPIHPPTLGQFVAACVDLPQTFDTGPRPPTIQAELCEYAAQHVHDLVGPKDGMTLLEYGRPWNYVYREWRDETRPKGSEKCCECIGIMIDLGDRRIGWSVAAMLADREGHAKAQRAFKPGPPPTPEQRHALERIP